MAAIKRTHRLAMLGLSAALMVAAAPASSQSDGQAPGAPSLDNLHRALNLSQGQERAWQAYRGEAGSTTAQDRRRAASQMFPQLAAPQRMDLVEAELKQELVDLERQSQALKTFYAALSPQQRAVFDAQTLPQQGSSQHN